MGLFKVKFSMMRGIVFLVYSVVCLLMHFFAIIQICNCVGSSLNANHVVNAIKKDAMAVQADTFRLSSQNFTSVFLIMCYLFPIIIGILLIIRKIYLIEYLGGIFCFWIVQCGIFILTKFINCYGMTEIHGRLGIVIHQWFTFYTYLIPLIFYSFLCLIKIIFRSLVNRKYG